MDYKKIAEEALAKRANVIEQMRSADQDGRSAEELRTFTEQAEADVARYTEEARQAVEAGEREAEARSLAERAGSLLSAAPAGDSGRRSEDRDAEREFEDQLRAIARGEARGMDIQGDSEFHARAARHFGVETRASGPNTAMTTTSAWAGTTIQTTFVGQVLDQFREHSPILQAGVRIVTTSTGETMEWPRRNAIMTAARVAEGATYGKSKSGFDRFALNAFKYGVIAEGTYEMLNDSQIPLAQFISSDIGEALADRTALDLLKGTGSGEPQGLVTGTTLNSALANAAALTTDALVIHTHALKPKYRQNAGWYVSDDFVLKVRLLKDAEGRYVWQPGITAGVGDTLLGKRVTVDVNMDDVNGGAKVPALFGDYSKFVVRVVGGVSLSRSDEYGWDSDIVAWKGSLKVGSGQSDALSVAKITVTA